MSNIAKTSLGLAKSKSSTPAIHPEFLQKSRNHVLATAILGSPSHIFNTRKVMANMPQLHEMVAARDLKRMSDDKGRAIRSKVQNIIQQWNQFLISALSQVEKALGSGSSSCSLGSDPAFEKITSRVYFASRMQASKAMRDSSSF